MKTIYDNWTVWQKLLTMLEHQFGNRCEFILHDLTKDYDHTIVDIRNGYITNRKIGDCGSNLGLEVLRGTAEGGDRYNYIVNTRDGKLLRSSTMYVCDDDGKTVGSLCINTDITETVRFEEYLRQYNQYNLPAPGSVSVPSINTGVPVPAKEEVPPVSEFFANDVTQLLDYLIAEAGKQVGKPVGQMHRDDKIKFVRYLDQKGAFLITKAAERIYEYLNISRFTLYNYLDMVRKETNGNHPADKQEDS